jgi:membrane protease YdiL (CAAX protease family)
MSAEVTIVAISIAVAFVAFAYMFALPRPGIWPRTWVAAGVVGATATAGLVVLGRFGEIVGPFTPTELAVGLAAGGVWLVATQVGYAVIARLFPAFGDQVRDLYRLGDEDTAARMVGPIVAMGVAEELLFRGVLQGVGGVALALVAYTAVQVFERKWALALAALLGGVVWGALFAWRGGLVAPIAAHVVWTGMLTFVWPLGGAPRPQESDPVGAGGRRDYASGKR